MQLFKVKRIFSENLGTGNPVFVQILGICSTLAVTNLVKNTIVMCIGLLFTLSLSNFSVSVIRKWMPSRIRMMVETLIIAAYVIIFDIIVKAYLPEISEQLGPYVGLIITNCIIMGRAEAFALSNPPFLSFIDGLSSAIGYSYVLIIIAVVREIFGFGTVFGITVMGTWWTKWSIMVMSPGAFFMLAIFIWVVKGVFMKPASEEGNK